MSNHGISEEFIDGMKSRMHLSHFKYGELKDSYPHEYVAWETVGACINKYVRTGNKEFLMDAANYCMIEFQCPAVEGAHFKATDSADTPGRVHAATGRVVKQK